MKNKRIEIRYIKNSTCLQLLTNAHRIAADEFDEGVSQIDGCNNKNNQNPIFVLSHPLLWRRLLRQFCHILSM